MEKTVNILWNTLQFLFVILFLYIIEFAQSRRRFSI